MGLRNAAIAFLVSMILVGCSSLTPYEEVAASLPAERLIEVDGQRIHVEIHGSGPALLMLHGFASSTYSYRKIIPELAKTNRVVAMDLNGFGFTERPTDLAHYRAEMQVETIRRLLEKLNMGRCDIVGHSYGGALAILLARDNPSVVRRLVLISPYTEFKETPLLLRSAPGRAIAYRGSRLLLGNRRIARIGVKKAFYQDQLVTPEVAEEYRRRLLIEGYGSSFHGYSLAMKESGPIELPLESTCQPTLIIAGERDRLVSLESCRRTAETMPNASLRVAEQSGHSAAEEQPEMVAKLITEFLGK